MKAGDGHGEQFAEAHAGIDQNQGKPGSGAAVGLQGGDIRSGKDGLLGGLFPFQLYETGVACGDDLLPDGPVGHLGDELLILGEGGILFPGVGIQNALKVRRSEAAKFGIMQRGKNIVSPVIGCNSACADLPVVLDLPRVENLGKGHIIPLGDRLAGQALQGFQGFCFFGVISDDDFILCGHPGAGAAAGQFIDRAGAVGALEGLAGRGGLLFAAKGTEGGIGGQGAGAFDTIHRGTSWDGAAGRGGSAAFLRAKKRRPVPTDRALPEPANVWVGGIVGKHSDEQEEQNENQGDGEAQPAVLHSQRAVKLGAELGTLGVVQGAQLGYTKLCLPGI